MVLSLELLGSVGLAASVQARSRSVSGRESLNQPEQVHPQVSAQPTSLAQFSRDRPASLYAKAVRFNPPKVGSPRRRTGAAVRGGCPNASKDNLVALLPTTEPILTVSEYPTLFVYLPQSAASEAELTLLSDNKRQRVYKTTIKLPKAPGIVGFSLPKDGKLPPLQVGKTYHWNFSITCGPADQAEVGVVEGQIQRIALSPSQTNALKKTALRDRPAFYAEAGIWYDALSSLAQLRRSTPKDAAIATDWGDLLKSVGLSAIAEKPLIP
ncbi:MAG: DUF928 domain-containing protein [Leptolyngbyaceae cyanobacterium RU_5_1]|nr:DUF928 domain-containing protein [Leptolyngbyaceae cyanobacterium RU_5_1]